MQGDRLAQFGERGGAVGRAGRRAAVKTTEQHAQFDVGRVVVGIARDQVARQGDGIGGLAFGEIDIDQRVGGGQRLVRRDFQLRLGVGPGIGIVLFEEIDARPIEMKFGALGLQLDRLAQGRNGPRIVFSTG